MSFLLHRRLDQDGLVESTTLELRGERIELVDDDGTRALMPISTLVTVLRRYGRALEPDITPEGPTLSLGEGRSLQALHHRAPVDVIGRDYVVLCEPAAEPLAALATEVAAALLFLARRRQ